MSLSTVEGSLCLPGDGELPFSAGVQEEAEQLLVRDSAEDLGKGGE